MSSAFSTWLLRPAGTLYGLGAALRNQFYNAGWLRSFAFDFPVIVVGNLQAGGTGKTPCVEFLVRKLNSRYPAATLSRGYGRRTRGYLLATAQSLPEDIGDEPVLLKRLFPALEVAVGENRVAAIPALLTDSPETKVIICDDAFQHRPLRGGLNLLLTGFGALYVDDLMLPAGRLREPVSGARRADAIIVTGCPPALPPAEQQVIAARLRGNPDQPVFFAGLEYATPYRLGRLSELFSGEGLHAILLVTGIARPERLRGWLEARAGSGAFGEQPAAGAGNPEDFAGGEAGRPGEAGAGGGTLRPEFLIKHLAFPDHHPWRPADLERIRLAYRNMIKGGRTVIFTTEKDAVRLEAFSADLEDLPIFVQPVRMAMLPDSADAFDGLLFGYVANAELDRPDQE